MPDKDVSGVAVELAQAKVARLRSFMKERMPYGPSKVKLSPEEFRRLWDKMLPETRLQMAQSMGYDEFLKQMTGIYHAKH